MQSRENKTNTSEKFNKGAVGKSSFFQPKLTINEPGDQYEQEADAMADKVMRMPMNGQPFFKPSPVSISRLQRKCQHCEEEEKLQRRENTSQPTEASGETSSYINSLSSKGSSLSESDRNFFEPRFGHDFSNVKIHSDNEAAKSAGNINALAYTTGNNIVFNQDQFSPESETGKKLLAHELTHVVQQFSKKEHNNTIGGDNNFEKSAINISPTIKTNSAFKTNMLFRAPDATTIPSSKGAGTEADSVKRGDIERGYFATTDRVMYGVRASGLEKPDGLWVDHLFESESEAAEYANRLAATGEMAIRKNSALAYAWPANADGTPNPGNPVTHVFVVEVPAGTTYIQGVVRAQPESSDDPGKAGIMWPGGGPQVVLSWKTGQKKVIAQFEVAKSIPTDFGSTTPADSSSTIDDGVIVHQRGSVGPSGSISQDATSTSTSGEMTTSPGGSTTPITPLAQRIVYIDANVLDQINRGNKDAAATLLNMLNSGDDVRISQSAYNEAVSQGSIQRLGTANQLLIESLGIKIMPPPTTDVQVDTHAINVTTIRNPDATVFSLKDARVIAGAREGKGEIWSFDGGIKDNSITIQKTTGVIVAPESNLPFLENTADYRVGRQLLGLKPVEISLTGIVSGELTTLQGGSVAPPGGVSQDATSTSDEITTSQGGSTTPSVDLSQGVTNVSDDITTQQQGSVTPFDESTQGVASTVISTNSPQTALTVPSDDLPQAAMSNESAVGQDELNTTSINSSLDVPPTTNISGVLGNLGTSIGLGILQSIVMGDINEMQMQDQWQKLLPAIDTAIKMMLPKIDTMAKQTGYHQFIYANIEMDMVIRMDVEVDPNDNPSWVFDHLELQSVSVSFDNINKKEIEKDSMEPTISSTYWHQPFIYSVAIIKPETVEDMLQPESLSMLPGAHILFNRMTKGSGKKLKITAKWLEKFNLIVPPNLSEDEINMIAKRMTSITNPDPDAVLDDLTKLIADLPSRSPAAPKTGLISSTEGGEGDIATFESENLHGKSDQRRPTISINYEIIDGIRRGKYPGDKVEISIAGFFNEDTNPVQIIRDNIPSIIYDRKYYKDDTKTIASLQQAKKMGVFVEILEDVIFYEKEANVNVRLLKAKLKRPYFIDL